MSLLSTAPIHLGIPTTHFDEAKKFYGETLGLKVVREAKGVALFEGGQETKLELFERAEPANAPQTLGGFTVPNIEVAVKELKANGVKFEHYEGLTVDGIAQTSPHTSCAWFRDPDGNYLVVTEWKE